MYVPQSLELKNIGSHTHTKYSFRKGKVAIIVGENLDDDGQEGNGSGKSYIGEGIAIALLGEPIRPIKNKEIVKDGSKQGSVKLELVNKAHNTSITIVRNFFTKGSSECYVWHGDKEVEKDSVDSKTKWILDELDISAEDLYDFYLITLTHYKAFFSISDGKKKAIVNRFSGADSIDQVEPFIKSDIEVEQQKVVAIQNKIVRSKARIEMFEENIQQLKDAQTPEAIELRAQEREVQIDSELAKVEVKEKELQALRGQEIQIKLSIAQLQLDIKSAEKSKKKIQDELLKVERSLEKPNKQIEQIKTDGAVKVKEYIKTIQRLETNLSVMEEELTALQEFKSELTNQLAGTIICPQCTHRFVLADEEFSVENGEEALNETKLEIEKTNNLIAELKGKMQKAKDDKRKCEEKIDEDTKALRTEVQSINATIDTIQQKLRSANQNLSTLTQQSITYNKSLSDIAVKQTTLNTTIESMIAQIEKMSAEEEDNDNSELLAKLQKEIDDETKEIEAFNVELEKQEAVKASLEKWIYDFKAFKSQLANQSIKNIEDYTNMFLQQINSNISISISGYKTLANNKLKEEIAISVLKNGFEVGSYGKFSGGERGRIDICCILAIQELINRNSKSGGLDLLLCDEIIDAVDSYGIECIVKGLNSLGRTIILISQHKIKSLAEQTITVRKENENSIIV